MNKAALLPAIAAGFLVGGCETFSGYFEDAPEEAIVTETPPVRHSIDFLSEFVAADEATQAQMTGVQRDAWSADPSQINQLYYALLLATPGHSDTNYLEAQSLLSQLLANPDGLDHEDLEITRVFMAYAQQWQRLQAKYDELSEKLDQAQASSQSQRDRQLNQMRQQVSALSQQLKDAEAKLDAIANIEKQMERPEPKQE
jgi:DNA repair exonuclease SbcCD ATPase subunit